MNTFTASVTTASIVTSITNLNTFTASVSTASLVTSITNLNTFTASNANTSLNTFTGSVVLTSSFNSYTASISTASLVTSITNLNSFSASENTKASALATYTSSINSWTSSFSSSLATSITSVSGTFTNLTVNGQPTTYGYVNGAYLLAQNTTDQSVGLNDVVNFQTTIASNGSIITKTSNSRVTLTAGNTYKLEGIIRRLSSSSTWAAFRWYDVTNSAYVGIEGFSEVTNATGAIGSTNVATYIVTPTVNTIYELRQTTVNTISVSGGNAGYEITQINPTIAVQSTATGTVAATIITDTNPVSTSNNGGSSTSPGLTILTLAIPSAGTWRLDSELRVYVPGAGYMAAAFYDNGTLIPGSEYFVAAGGVTQTGAATGQYSGFMSYDLTTTSARTVTVGIWSTTSANAIDSGDGRTWARATKIDSTFALNALDTMQISNSLAVTGSTTLRGAVNVGTGSGLEGGEIDLAYAQTTSLTGSAVIFDVYADKLRIFENGGNNRGAYLNVASQSNSVGSSIVTSPNLLTMQTITSASYAALTPVSGTLYIIIG